MTHTVIMTARGLLGLAALGVLATPAAPQGKVFGGSISNVKTPGLVLLQSVEEIGKGLGAAPNSDGRQSGFSLQRYFDKPFARELVWAFDLTDPMPLVFTSAGWVKGDPTPRTVRMYYHVGFDTAGKAVAAAQWYTGPVPGRGPGEPVGGLGGERATRRQRNDSSRIEMTVPLPTFWNYCFPRILESYGDPARLTLEIFNRGSAQVRAGKGGLGKGHKCPKNKICQNCGWDDRKETLALKSEIGIVQAAREAGGAYGSNGLVMATGTNRQGGWALVGELWGISRSVAGQNGNPPPFWVIGRADSTQWSLSDIRLVLAWARENEPEKGKIVPTTNDQATIQDGVK